MDINDNKQKKCEFATIIKNILIRKWVFIFALISLMLSIAFNFKTVPIELKIVMIIVSGLNILYFGSFFAVVFIKQKWKDFGFSIFFLISCVIEILNFIDYNLWGSRNLVLGLLYVVIFFYGIYYTIAGLLNDWVTSEKLPIILIAIAATASLIAASNEQMDNLLYANLYYKISIGLIYLIAIALYINQYLYKERKQGRSISNIISLVFVGALILISFPFYVRWWGLNSDDFNAFVSVYSALVGGGITLTGVAWTIRKGDSDRKADLLRIEQERKEEERKIHVPYLKVVVGVQPFEAVNCHIMQILDFDDEHAIAKLENNIFYTIMIDNFIIKNVSSHNILLRGVILDDEFYQFDNQQLLESNNVCQVQTTRNSEIAFAKPLRKLLIYVEDIIGNAYTVSCKLNPNIMSAPIIMPLDNGKEYHGYAYKYTIENLSLPILVED